MDALNILLIPSLQMMNPGPEVIARIREAAGPNATVRLPESRGEALEAIGDADVLLGKVDPPLLAAAPRLKWVHATTAGADDYLFPEMLARDVLISGDKGLVGSHLAETAFGLLLALTRRIAVAYADGPRSWEKRVDYRVEEFELVGLTMGIVGFGGTGRAIARRAAGFEMECIAVDAYAVPPSPEVPEVWGMDRFEELLARSDVVASGVPFTPTTDRMFNDSTFARFKRGAIFVNVTRGEICDPDALIRALESGQLGGAGLDVAHEEPLPADHPLWTTRNVVMTPHTAGASQFRLGRNLDRFCRNLVLFREGKPLEGLIDRQTGF